MKMLLETDTKRPLLNITANQCPGCPENLVTRLAMQVVMDVLGDQDPIIFGQGCGIGRDFLQRSGLGTHDSACVGMRTAMRVRGIDRPIVVIDGDGQVDMGLADMATAFQQGYRFLHIMCNNQTHAASGSHTTGGTDPFARTSVRPEGRSGVRKEYPLMLMFSGAQYVAKAATSHPQDLERKIKSAVTRLPAFIEVLTPCNPSWGYDDSKSIEVTRLAVQCGMWPLYEWKDGKFNRSNVRHKATVRQYVSLQRRYSHLTEEQIEAMEEFIREQDDRLDRLKSAYGA